MFEMSKTKLAMMLGLLLFTFNPTGYSYFDYMLVHNWVFDWLSVCVGTLGLSLMGIILFLITVSWRSTEIMGKIIYLVPVVGVGLLSYLGGVFGSYSFSLFAIYTFILWGMAYPRLKFSMFKERNVGEVDPE